MAILTNQQLSKNLEISGIPCQPKEDCASIALKVARKIHPQIQEDEIAEAYRVGRQKDEQGKERLNRSILVKFRSLTTRDIIFKNKRVLTNVDTSNLGLSNLKKRIYVNENLSYETRSLFRLANNLKKENNWKFIWTNSGTIYVKKDVNSKILSISSIKDLDVMKA